MKIERSLAEASKQIEIQTPSSALKVAQNKKPFEVLGRYLLY
jgi:hypothetical protein